MSTFSVPIVRIAGFGPVKGADTLNVTNVLGLPVVFKNGSVNKGDLAVYVPLDAVVPTTHSAFAFLKDPNRPQRVTHRVKARRFLGTQYSEGMLVPVSELGPGDWVEGQDVQDVLGIVKYEEPEPQGEAAFKASDAERDPGFMPVYDMESYHRYRHLLVEGERVICTEKVHGMNFRACWKDGRLWVGSHKTMKKESAASIWWAVALAHGLDKKLVDHEGLVVYGEVFGYNGNKRVQDLTYGAKPGETRFAVFDVYNSNPGERGFLSHDALVAFCEKCGLDRVPVLYDGPYSDELVRPFAYGTSTFGNNIREGFVIRPAEERWNNETRRTIFKFVSEDYKLRGNGTEFH